MFIVRSHSGIPVRLTAERWQHIARRHPELVAEEQRILETLAEPDMIQEGDFGALLAVRLYARTTLTSKWMVVAYREVGREDGFIMTAYLARRPSARRRVVWKR